jgi:Fe-S-cluster containining protein
MLDKLHNFYDELHEKTQKLEQIHASRLNCKKGCSNCCVDGLTVFTIEAENIKQNHADLLPNEQPNINGGCAFLDENGACRIYESRPYVCRTQGLPLRWMDEVDDEIVEFRDICPLNEDGTPIEALDAEDCWSIGEFEQKLADLQAEFDNGKMFRIALRKLFN